DTTIGQFRFGLSSVAGRPLTGGVNSQAAGYVRADETANCPTSSWQHVALVADGATLRLYRNGVLAVTNAYNGTIVSPSAISNLFIGARIADDGINLNAVPGYWTGKMDDLGMWTRGLTADEVLGIYAAGYNHQPLTTASSTGVKPIIATPPDSLSVTEGDDARFTVAATGAAPLGYQWRKGGVPISGATNASLVLHSAVLSDAADYTVVVANFVGSVTSAPAATLTVTALSLPLPPITKDLVAYWKFDETAGTNALDSAGINNAALNNYLADNSQWVPGMVGGALAFYGSSEFGYVADYPKPESNMTVAAWVWAESRPGWASILKNWGDSSGGQFHFALYDTAGDLSIFVQQADGSFPNTREGVPFPLGSWQHVVFTCDGTSVRLFRNGIQVASVPYDGTLQPSPVMTCLGIGVKTDNACAGASTQAPGYWNGKMDDMGLWTRGLASVEIQAIYSSGLGGRNLEQASLSPAMQVRQSGSSLVFSWPEAPLGRGFVLESTTSLSPASWGPAGGTVTVANGQCSVSLPAASAGQNFYRLRQ
ncbi:MAG: immunoglobulin domain-containing protein, partial [Verrucomicrobia bacterium]|nr:immunoglobulin domain-containing protein [Verrucomicrobiota bacterium]